MKALIVLAGLIVLVAWAGPGGPRTAATAADDRVAQGRALFQDKGCITCHRNTRSGGVTVADAYPDLSNYHNDPEFLRRWLADPGAVKPGTIMPDLGLAPDEIEALIAFLNAR